MNLDGVFQLQETIFVLMLVGAFLKKCGLVSDEGQKALFDLFICLALPCSIVKSFTGGLSLELLRNFGLIIVVTTVFLFGSMALGELLFHKKTGNHKMIMQYGTLCSNAGIMGNAVAEGIFSDIGILYASVALVPIRVFMWSVGLAYFTAGVEKRKMVAKGYPAPLYCRCCYWAYFNADGHCFAGFCGAASGGDRTNQFAFGGARCRDDFS